MPLVSIIIPIHNTEAFLRECLDSVVSQTCVDIEIIAVDDGSTDSTPAILEEYSDRYPAFRVVNQINKGVSAARNTGIAHAKGEWITFVDSDDVVSPYLVSSLLDIAQSKERPDIVCAALKRGTAVPNGTRTDKVEYTTGLEALRRMLRQRGRALMNNSSPCAKLVKTELVRSSQFTEGIKYEDLEWLSRLYTKSGVQKVAFIHSQIYAYRRHKGAFTGHFSAKRLDSLKVTEDIERRCSVLSPEIYAAARDRRLSAAFHVFNEVCNADFPDKEMVKKECYSVIRQRRAEVLGSREARIKNRVGAAVSYLGPGVLSLLARVKFGKLLEN